MFCIVFCIFQCEMFKIVQFPMFGFDLKRASERDRCQSISINQSGAGLNRRTRKPPDEARVTQSPVTEVRESPEVT